MGCAWGSGNSSKKKRSQTVDSNYNQGQDDPKEFKPDATLPDNQSDAKEQVPTIEEEIKEENPSEALRVRKVITFTYQEMVDATENFKPDYFIGRGGFGTVYKGILEETNQVVAIKRLDHTSFQGDREFDAEVMTLSVADHPNLVKLLGCCAEEEQRLLVYEFMPLGSLETHLHDLKPDQLPLDWNTRMKIAAGVARGLEYLHNKMNPPIIYRDLKSPNILLDDNFNPKLSDFGLAKVGPQGDNTHVTTRVMGTYGYCAPEYLVTGKITFQSDIFSFGVLLLELITGRKALHKGQHLVEWALPFLKDKKNHAEMADPGLKQQYPARGLDQILTTAYLCVRKQPNMRPLVADIVSALNYIAAQKYEPSNCSSSG